MAFMRDPLYILMQDGEVQISPKEGGVGITIPQETFDIIVMMRYYNMTELERRSTTETALEEQVETGADGIRKAYGLSTVEERVKEQLMEEGTPKRLVENLFKGSSTSYEHEKGRPKRRKEES